MFGANIQRDKLTAVANRDILAIVAGGKATVSAEPVALLHHTGQFTCDCCSTPDAACDQSHHMGLSCAEWCYV